MNILTQFREISEKNIKENLGDYLYNMVSYFTNPYNIDAYKKFAENFDEFTDRFTKKAYEVFIHALDEEFMQSNTRKQRYESKGYVTKPFLTKFGWITLKKMDVELENIKTQEEEVGSIKWASIEEINTMIKNDMFLPPHIEFFNYLLEYLNHED